MPSVITDQYGIGRHGDGVEAASWLVAGLVGHAGQIAHDRPLHDSKKWAPLWILGGDAHHYRFFLPCAPPPFYGTIHVGAQRKITPITQTAGYV
jgi:hypothetical protein